MGYREPPNQASIVNFSGDNAVQKVEGLYRGYTTQPSSYGGVTKIQSFDNNGEIVSVYSKGQLDYKLSSIPNGTWVRVTCQGKEDAEIVVDGKSIKTKCYQFTVEINDERSEVKENVKPTVESDEDIPY